MSNDEQTKILARVRKLLALANDAAATEGERDNAMRMAHNTLAKHNLSLAQAEQATGEQDNRGSLTVQSPGHAWARTICYAVAELFFCQNFFMRHWDQQAKVTQYFVGRQENAISASEMANYLIASVTKEANMRKRAGAYDNTWHRSFCKGAASRIYQRCIRLRKEAEEADKPVTTSTGTSLVLASFYEQESLANNKFIKQELGFTLKDGKNLQRNTDWNGHAAGAAYGDKVGLHRQVGGGSKAKQLT